MQPPDQPIQTEAIRNFLRANGFSFDRQADRVMLWKKGTQRAALNRKDWVTEATARQTLQNAGFAKDVIDRFIGECRSCAS